MNGWTDGEDRAMSAYRSESEWDERQQDVPLITVCLSCQTPTRHTLTIGTPTGGLVLVCHRCAERLQRALAL